VKMNHLVAAKSEVNRWIGILGVFRIGPLRCHQITKE